MYTDSNKKRYFWVAFVTPNN